MSKPRSFYPLASKGEIARLEQNLNVARLRFHQRRLSEVTALHESAKTECETLARQRIESSNAVFQLERSLGISAVQA